MNLFEELPPEILTKILYYLTPKDLLNTSKISNNLLEISQRVLKEKLLILKLNKSTNVEEIKELLEYNCIEKLRLENDVGVHWEDQFLTFVQEIKEKILHFLYTNDQLKSLYGL